MVNNAHPPKGKGKTSSTPQKASAAKYSITLHYGTSGTRKLDAGKLDQKAIADIVGKLNKEMPAGKPFTMAGMTVTPAGKPVTLEMTDLLSWPAKMRCAVWRLWKALVMEGNHNVIINGTQYHDPVPLVSAVLGENMANHSEMCRAMDMVVEAIIAYYRAEDHANELANVVDGLRRGGHPIWRCRKVEASLNTRLKNAAQGNGATAGPADGAGSPQAPSRKDSGGFQLLCRPYHYPYLIYCIHTLMLGKDETIQGNEPTELIVPRFVDHYAVDTTRPFIRVEAEEDSFIFLDVAGAAHVLSIEGDSDWLDLRIVDDFPLTAAEQEMIDHLQRQGIRFENDEFFKDFEGIEGDEDDEDHDE